MPNKDLHRFQVGLNTDDTPAELKPGEYTDALNMRITSSSEQQGFGRLETLQAEIALEINVSAQYYGGAIGGEFIYEGYPEVQIGNQVWMKNNWDKDYPGSKVYNDDEDNRAIYGGLYKWDQIKSSNFLPVGWRIPTEIIDFNNLLAELGGAILSGGKMKEVGTEHWNTPNIGADDSSGFRALPGGYFDTIFRLLQQSGLFWIDKDSEPPAPVANEATNIAFTSFLANWESLIGADGYCIDVSEDINFGSFLPGYENIDVGNVTSYSITGLTYSSKYYYYRVRAYNDIGTSVNSNSIAVRMITFKVCLVRNKELDNSLSIAGSTLLTISNKVGQVLTVNNLPDYDEFDTLGWAALLSDPGKMSGGGDPTTAGDYLYRNYCTINRATKELTFPPAYALTQWTVGDNLVLFNPFLNYQFVGNQIASPLISVVGAPAWRSTYSVGGGMFKRADGTYIWMITGYAPDGTTGSIGYAESADGVTWVMGNADAPIFTADMVIDDSFNSITTSGSVFPLNDGTGRYACPFLGARGGITITKLLYFDENFTTFTYSASLLDETTAGGCSGGSIIKIGNFYHILYTARLALAADYELRAAKSLNIEGPYVDYQMILKGSGSNDGVAWSNHTDAFTGFKYQDSIFGFFGATSRYARSGTRGNREYCLMQYNTVTELWEISTKGPVFLNPMYFWYFDGSYPWCWDHGGGYTSFFVDDNGDIFISSAFMGGVYQATLCKF
jgi:uncharacterized protein (TIGR02145 family)